MYIAPSLFLSRKTKADAWVYKQTHGNTYVSIYTRSLTSSVWFIIISIHLHMHTRTHARALLGWDGQTNVHLFTQNKNKSYLRTRACGSYICYHRKKYLVKLTNIRQFVFKNVCWLIID